MFDTHSHINFAAFKDDVADVISRCLKRGIDVLIPGTQYDTSLRAIKLAQENDGMYAAVGLHPIHIGESREVDLMEVQSDDTKHEPWMTFPTRDEDFDADAYRKLTECPEVVAIGECGLDFYRLPKSKPKRRELKERQRNVLQKQLDLAKDTGLPVVMHCRAAFDDLYEMLSSSPKGSLRGVIHSFTGTKEQAEQFLDLGWYLGFNGLIFKDIPALPDPAEVIYSVPLDRILLETDAPYLIPSPAEKEGHIRNEPLFVTYVADRVAEIKGLSKEDITARTSANARALFDI